MNHLSGRWACRPLSFLFLFSSTSLAHVSQPNHESFQSKPVLASLADLRKLQIPILAEDSISQVGFAYINNQTEFELQAHSHQNGKCGGFEDVSADLKQKLIPQDMLQNLQSLAVKHQSWQRIPWRPLNSNAANDNIVEALSLVQETQLHETVTWLSSFKNRHERDPNGSAHIYQMKIQIEKMLENRQHPWSAELITHTSTPQKSLRVRLLGKTHPDEIIVLGGHHDSVNHSWSSGNRDRAPGADDNASGSANLLEILRVLADQPLNRTIEFIWYAGEEAGLLGSAEIAKSYKQDKKNVIAVLQLDMTAYPGSGEMTITNITDFTHPWLQELMKQLNEIYVGLRILDDKCGYGCSDHASWHRQGFATVLPFEATSRQMNPNIHTTKDTVSPSLNFKHSAAITKLALAFAMELGNSDLRPPQ